MSTEIDRATVQSLLPERRADAHKGTFGHVFVLAGSRGFTGAVQLTCEAATRSGAGLVTAGVPRPLADAVAAMLVESMSLPLPATEAESLAHSAVGPALEFSVIEQAVVLGPGLSQHPGTRAFVLDFVRQCLAPTLIDADGLNALSTAPEVLLDAASARVVTPHPGEMGRLMGQAAASIQRNREEVAMEFAAQYKCVVVLKGRGTVVTDGTACYVNPTGNAGMATGGTGDVLSGLIGGLMAQGLDGLHAAVVGVYVHGLAGDLAAAAKTQRGMVARDVIQAIPDAWREIEGSA